MKTKSETTIGEWIYVFLGLLVGHVIYAISSNTIYYSHHINTLPQILGSIIMAAVYLVYIAGFMILAWIAYQSISRKTIH